MAIKMVRTDELPINILNPRYVPQESEIKEMNLIISNGSIEALIEDIAKYGPDPTENLLVSIDSEGNYIVEEGNRRLTAIKILNDPEVVPQIIAKRAEFLKKVKQIIESTNFKKIDEIQCAVEEDADKVKHFVKLKHTGQNGGAGRMGWDTESKTRFDTDNLFRQYLLDTISSILPGKTEKFNFTTIERIISDPDMRKAFSLKLDRKVPSIEFTTERGKELFEHVIKGLSEGTYKVNHFHSKEDRLRFIKFLDELYPIEIEEDSEIDDGSQDSIDEPIEPITDDSSVNINKGPEGEKSNPFKPAPPPPPKLDDSGNGEEPKKRRKVLRRQPVPKSRKYPFQGINYRGDIPGIRSALHELHSIPNIYDFPLAATTLFRTLFECTVQEYIEKNSIEIHVRNGTIKDLSIDSLLTTCCNPSNNNFRNLRNHDNVVARIINEANGKRDQDELNVVTHGIYRIASKHALEDMERRWFEAIKIMIDEISDGS